MKNAKQILRATLLVMALISVVSCKNETKKKSIDTEKIATADLEQSQPEFKDANVAETFKHYLHLKTALVKTDAKDAENGAKMIASTTENVDVKTLATALASETDIAKQREQFSKLTELLKPILLSNLTSGEIYEQNCPMALSRGANWFAIEKQINNPYFGDAMLHCGSL